mmetsp:Transcript_2800/g.4132  ORF Transcript_2800/g.4132 Transcript_2800/m.4132 type:complete len:608 (+) Transcript_2800:52-1875(+)
MALQQVGGVPAAMVGSHIRRSLPLCGGRVASVFSTTASDGCHHRHHRRSSYHHQRSFFHNEFSQNKHSYKITNFSTSSEKSDVSIKEELAKNTSDTDTTSNPESSSSPVKISMDELLALASCQPTPLSLKAMFEYAPKKASKKSPSSAADILDRLRNSQFLHRELPIRIAQRAIDLLTLPYGLNRTKEVQSIANTYLQYLQKLRDFPMPTNAESEREFTDQLKSFILDRHSIPMAIARGLQSLEDGRRAPMDVRRLAEMEDALSRFFTARVGLRFLVEHHVLTGNEESSDALYRQQLEAEGGLELLENDPTIEMPSDDDCCGSIQQNCDPVLEVRRTAARVTKLCRESYGIAPEIEVVDCTLNADADAPFTYVPHHLRYMLAELLKNSCRATVKSYLSGTNMQKEDHTKHGESEGLHDAPSLSPIRVVVTKGAEDVTIKIADRGGGMPRSVAKRIWSFAHSTRTKEGKAQEGEKDFGKDEFTGGHIRGFGLPLARIYARYFGGEVTIKSMEGYGVDAYIYLPVLGVACENLPQRVNLSPGNLDSSHGGEILDGDGYYDSSEPPNDGYKTDGTCRNDDFFDASRNPYEAEPSRRSLTALNALDEKALH